MKFSVILSLLIFQFIYCKEGNDLENYAIILVMLSLIIGFYLVCFLPYIILDMINKKNELIPPTNEVQNNVKTEENPISQQDV